MNEPMYKPKKRRFKYDDPFFDDGNRECTYHNKTVDEDIDFIIDSLDSITIDEFTCHVKGCSKTFTNPLQFNRHFDMAHKFRCEHCGRNFPSNYLLGLHLQENHDSFFQAQKDKGLAVYECIIDSCKEKFTTEEARKKHLVKIHSYPSDFRFNAVRRVHAKYKTTKTTKANSKGIKLLPCDQKMEEEKEDGKPPTKQAPRRRSKAKKKTCQNEMDVEFSEINENEVENLTDMKMTATSPNKYDYRRTTPKSISFGRGVEKGFSRTRYK